MTTLVSPVGAGLVQRMDSLARGGLVVILAWCGLMLAWATLAPISGGVVMNGLVKVDANRRTVSHRDGGTVARILVREGQSVHAGDVLIELADARVDAAVDMLRAQAAADRLRRSRLEAETAGATRWAPPAQLFAAYRGVVPLDSLAAREETAFASRLANLAAQVDGVQAQADSARSEIAARLRERDTAQRALTLMRDELAMNRQLEREQFVNRARLMTLERGVSEYEAQVAASEADLSQAQQRLRGFVAQVDALRRSRRQSSAEELREVESRLSDIEQRLRSSSDDQARQRVLAPASGRLLNLRVNTPGSALGPREPIVDIVPDGAEPVIEARLPLDEAAEVRAGMAAEARLVTQHARYQRLWPAEVLQVAADAQQDERSGASFVKVLVRLKPAGADAEPAALQPGMAAEVYVKVVERTPLGFLLEPVAGYFRRAFRGA